MQPRLFCAALIAIGVIFAPGAPASAARPTGPVARLHALFERGWDQDLRADPLAATYVGATEFNDRWPDVTPAAAAKIHAEDTAVLEALKKVPRGELPPTERLNYDLFEREYRQRQADWPFHLEYA